MNKITNEPIHDEKIKKYANYLVIGSTFLLGTAAGVTFGYKKWGHIRTIIDPWTGAVILTKRRLSYDECYKLAGIAMENGHNVPKALSDIGMLYGQ